MPRKVSRSVRSLIACSAHPCTDRVRRIHTFRIILGYIIPMFHTFASSSCAQVITSPLVNGCGVRWVCQGPSNV